MTEGVSLALEACSVHVEDRGHALRRVTVLGKMPPQMMDGWVHLRWERLCVCKFPLGVESQQHSGTNSTHLSASCLHFLIPFSLLYMVS